MRCFYLLLFICTCVLSATAQHLHFSQFYNNPLRLNPALTGAFTGHLRGSLLYRQQWSAVPVPYQTLSGAFDWKGRQRGKNGLAFAALLEHDRAGDAALQWSKLGGLVSVSHQIGVNLHISAGFGTEFAQRSFNIDALRFQKQWNGDVFNGNLPNGESFNRSSGIFPLLSGGFNVHYEHSDKRNQADIGAGAFHLNRPNVGFRQDERDLLPVRWTGFGMGAIQCAEHTDAVWIAGMQLMARATEMTAGGGIRQILAARPGLYWTVQMTAAWRWKDAIIPAIQMTWNDWTVGMSYDINTSPFKIATQRRGGPEVSVIYRPIPVPSVKTVKCCPIF
jgi:type IX secretion system PorP/SprF family membrane protein